MCTYVCVLEYLYIDAYKPINTYAYTYAHVYIHTYVYIYAFTYMYTHLFSNMYFHTYPHLYKYIFLRWYMHFILLMARIPFLSTGSNDQSFAWLHGFQRFCTYGNKCTYEYFYVHVYVCICLNQDSGMRVYVPGKNIYMAFSSSADMVTCIHTYMYQHMRICIYMHI